jgi:hypothetical protein
MPVWTIIAVTAGRERSRIGRRPASACEGETAPGVPEHPGGQVDADRGPTQLADLVCVDAGAAADLQANDVARAEEVT